MFEPAESADYSCQTDNELKKEGNRLFKARRYAEAIECYSLAIVSKIYIIT